MVSNENIIQRNSNYEITISNLIIVLGDDGSDCSNTFRSIEQTKKQINKLLAYFEDFNVFQIVLCRLCGGVNVKLKIRGGECQDICIWG